MQSNTPHKGIELDFNGENQYPTNSKTTEPHPSIRLFPFTQCLTFNMESTLKSFHVSEHTVFN